MNRDELKARLDVIAANILGCPAGALADATAAGDIPGWDSLNHVKLLVAIEQALGVRFGNDDLEDPRNWGDFIDVVARKVGLGA